MSIVNGLINHLELYIKLYRYFTVELITHAHDKPFAHVQNSMLPLCVLPTASSSLSCLSVLSQFRLDCVSSSAKKLGYN